MNNETTDRGTAEPLPQAIQARVRRRVRSDFVEANAGLSAHEVADRLTQQLGLYDLDREALLACVVDELRR